MQFSGLFQFLYPAPSYIWYFRCNASIHFLLIYRKTNGKVDLLKCENPDKIAIYGQDFN